MHCALYVFYEANKDDDDYYYLLLLCGNGYNVAQWSRCELKRDLL